ncbi:MAG: hypothetical protein CMI60_21065 [Parvibaculum sp.]|nr:hypothetical protein [Parvibaculum sp.]
MGGAMKLSKLFSWEFIFLALLFPYLLLFISGCSFYGNLTAGKNEIETLLSVTKNSDSDFE